MHKSTVGYSSTLHSSCWGQRTKNGGYESTGEHEFLRTDCAWRMLPRNMPP